MIEKNEFKQFSFTFVSIPTTSFKEARKHLRKMVSAEGLDCIRHPKGLTLFDLPLLKRIRKTINTFTTIEEVVNMTWLMYQEDLGEGTDFTIPEFREVVGEFLDRGVFVDLFPYKKLVKAGKYKYLK